MIMVGCKVSTYQESPGLNGGNALRGVSMETNPYQAPREVNLAQHSGPPTVTPNRPATLSLWVIFYVPAVLVASLLVIINLAEWVDRPYESEGPRTVLIAIAWFGAVIWVVRRVIRKDHGP